MREHVSQSKKATTASFSIPSLKHRIPGFGLESSQALPQAVPLVQPLHKPLTHDISRMSLHCPQAKLSISQPGDKYEQEADRVAQQVMQRMAHVNRQSIQPEARHESEQLQMKPLANSIRPLQRQEMPESESELQMKSLDNSTLQREALPEDEEQLQMKPMVQRRAEALMADAPDLEASINQARGGGQAMADNIRQPMEVAFGADFSGVKVHTDGQSDQLNRSINARAFTTKRDVFFRQGEYNPGSRGGQELLAHELTHVVQQNGWAVRRSRINSPQQPSETAPSISDLQRSPFPNKMEENFGQEVTEANEAAMTTDYEQEPGPYAQGTRGFDAFINTGKMFKWIFGDKNKLVVISPSLKHSVAAGGGEAITAGHGQKTAEGRIWINNDTGHYQTTLQSLDLSVPAWKNAGYEVQTRERTDYAAVLNNFGGGKQNQCNIM